jgi:hypothetical protein
LSNYEIENALFPRYTRNDLTLPLQCDAVNKDFENFKSAVTNTLETNLKLLDELPLPKHFDAKELRAFFKSKIKTDLEKDKTFEKAIEIQKYAKTMFESMIKYFNEIFVFHDNLKRKQNREVFYVSKMFLNSDLPLQFLKTVNTSILIQGDFIDIFNKRIRKERVSLITSQRSRPKFERVCNEHNKWVKGFCDRENAIERQRVKLLWYVDLCNSKNVNELFKQKTIKRNLMDQTVFSDLIENLRNENEALEELIYSNYEFAPLEYQIDESVKALTTLVQIIG